jgi:hypothetical protein
MLRQITVRRRVQFNEHQERQPARRRLEPDLRRIEKATGFGFFHCRPRLWIVSEVEPLEALQITHAGSQSSPHHQQPPRRRWRQARSSPHQEGAGEAGRSGRIRQPACLGDRASRRA